MDWFLSLQVPVQVALITGVIGATTIILNTWLGKRNLIISKERRFIDTISSERIKWLKEIRESFVEFSTKTTEFAIVLEDDRLISKVDSEDIREFKELIELLIEIHSIKQKIKLLLNPTEDYVIKLNYAMEELLDVFSKKISDTSISQEEITKVQKIIEHLQQIILKSEWKRIIVEIENGRKLTKEQVAEIFKNTAKSIQ